MKAAIYEAFHQPLTIAQVPDPVAAEGAVVVAVKATGICLSDWHGWMGHDADITPPHVPGHELAGLIESVGPGVRNWKRGDRVTLPFVGGCGACEPCRSGNQQVCDHQFQPGFTHWGSFAEYVEIRYADTNVVALPDEIGFVSAAGLGCRFITSFRAVVDQGRLRPGEWMAVHGCGGVGLSAIMIGHALGARIIAVDINPASLELAAALGADHVIDASKDESPADAIRDLSRGGAHLSIDALGSRKTAFNSVACLRKRGRHVQVGLMTGDDSCAPVPMDRIIAHELELLGSHGMQAHRYPRLMDLILSGRVQPEKLVQRTVTLEESLDVLQTMDRFDHPGITVIDRF